MTTSHIAAPGLGRRGFAATLAALTTTTTARAESFPGRPLRLVMPYGPGSEPDTVGRLLAQGMGAALGQPVVVENRNGGSSMIGAEAVANAKPDGYTLLFGGSTVFAANPHLFRNIRYSFEQFQPITLLMRGRIVLYTHAARGYTGVQDLVARIRAAPGRFRFGSAGHGNGTHLSAEQFRAQAGLDVSDISYTNSSGMQQALLRDDVDFVFDGVGAYLPLVQEGRLRPLGIAGPNRIAVLPNLPTFAEQGFPELGMPYWYGLYAPAGLPPAVLARLHEAALRGAADPTLLARAEQQGATVETLDVERFTAMNRSEHAAWGQLIRALNIRLD
ncbi:tripartite tricarboxylate transporter substrate binding protein [Roseomonas sp. GC11]|uniref:tripartite tricarboxylate transporter substrate binding protein n=1 Tax=Roseomonas sp. GC11 TaxID=2950546 RepID=UPI00210B62F9|nr:tripartite tricarboxylate transporter substrate binding protein [Roseomonas sp. GC11]MCQ4159023.1 tripartite tricarboxylate transporter substrate binding protein [Roseomonas sp. GC11]